MSSSHDVILATGLETTSEDGNTPGITCTHMSRANHIEAGVQAGVARYRKTFTPANVAEEILRLDDHKVTVVQTGTNMLGATVVTARPGTIKLGGTAFLPKGARTNGFRFRDPSSTLDITEGYDTSVVADRMAACTGIYGPLAPLTQEVLRTLPVRGNDCTLAVLVSWPDFDGGKEAGCLELLHSYMAGDDICEGMLIVPDDSPLFSETGSVYGAELRGRTCAVMAAALPVSLGDVIDLHNEGGYEAVLAAVTGRVPAGV